MIAALWLGLFAPQLLAGRTFVLGDAAIYSPFAELSRSRWLETHERTLWNPYVLCGVASAASLADERPQYLPDAALDLIEFCYRLPGWPPLLVPLLAHLAGMLAAALLARSLWGTGGVGMAWAGLAWGLMTNLVVPLGFGHHAKFLAASLMPVVLLLTHALFAATTPLALLRAATGLALALGVQCLGGHPQVVVYSAMLAAAFSIERAWAHRRPGRLPVALAAAGFGVVISAAVWWPALLYNVHSTRGGGVALEAVRPFSLMPRDLITLVWPWAVGHSGPTYWGGLGKTDYPQYLGILTVALAPFAWRRVGRDTRGPLAFFLAVAVVGILLSLGSNLGGGYRLLNAIVPFASPFRVAVMSLFVAQLAVALLSARGIEQALAATHDRRSAWPTRAMLVALAALLALVLGAGIAWGPLHQSYVAAMIRARAGTLVSLADRAAWQAGADLGLRALLLGVVTIALGAAAAGRARVAGLALIAALALDLGSVSLPSLRRATGTEPQLGPPPSALGRVAAADPRYRAMPLRGADLFSNAWILWRARSIGGMHGAEPGLYGDLMRHGLPRRYNVICALAVRYIDADSAAAAHPSLYEPVVENGATLPVLRVRRALPRAYAVTEIFKADEASILAAMASPSFVPAEVGASEEAEAEGHYPGSRATEIRWLRDDPDHLELGLTTPESAFVVVADAHFPGWSATLDGTRVPIHRVNHLLRGVRIPPGRHRLAMSYQPEGWAPGIALTRTGLVAWAALAAALAIAARRRSARSRPSPPAGAPA